jgi:hypothetical protein
MVPDADVSIRVAQVSNPEARPMDAKAAFKTTYDMGRMVTTTYLSDLNDADLFVRPVPGMNHIAWQLGHLIASEQSMIQGMGYSAAELPEGFAAAHSMETASSDDRSRFLTKPAYLDLADRVRKATIAALERTSDADLDKPAPERMRSYAPTVGAVFGLIGTHEFMHSGQFVAVRRKLGKPVVI